MFDGGDLSDGSRWMDLGVGRTVQRNGWVGDFDALLVAGVGLDGGDGGKSGRFEGQAHWSEERRRKGEVWKVNLRFVNILSQEKVRRERTIV